MTRVVILYSTAGGGHYSLAQASVEALTKFSPNKFEVILFNPFPPSFSYTHKTLANHFIDVYRFGLKATENPKMVPAVKGLNEITIASKITKFLKDHRPDIVIANHPLAAAALPQAISKSYICPKTVIHFADPFTTHKSWFINKSADLYLSPTPEMTKLAQKNGIPKHKIKTTGWLTKQNFVTGPNSPELSRHNLGLNPKKFTIFLGGAGVGSSKTYEICKLLCLNDSLLNSAQVIVNTGLNIQLVTKIMSLVQKHPNFLTLIPYSNNLAQYIWASDIVIGKAGPNFIFETIHSLRPLIITDYLPGHEDQNPKFIKKANLGWYENTPEKVLNRILKCLKNPHDISLKLPQLQKYKHLHLNSSENFTQNICDLLPSASSK